MPSDSNSPSDSTQESQIIEAHRCNILLSLTAVFVELIHLIFGSYIIGLLYIQLVVVLITIYSFYVFRNIPVDNNLKSTIYENRFAPIVAAIISMLFHSAGYQSLDDDLYFKTIFILFGVLLLLYTVSNSFTKMSIIERLARMVFYGMWLFLFSWVFVNYTNMVMDKSIPERYQTTVLRKEVTKTSKSTFYDVLLGGWENHPAHIWTRVDEKEFEKVSKGQQVEVYVYPGNLHIPWYEVIIH
ncbi:hypothetical protein CLV59_105278 [Chitinophaga dinghuensis]|uniref:Uncharacterized protein n=1 Tax=Chitinophaga dinghuensis TaxID=1539050 RepID=A0A327VY95_9BACT|nr:hypothetical protein [Chitinophaga dinghuensis]RAJ80170.1 hypothetical protein CLV59_105278 [Chitinophaga dinghuensis]